MAHYIDKDALIAEINRQHKILMQTDHTYGAQFVLGFRQACRQIIDFIDTFEAKEVDFEKESELIANGIMISVQSNKYDALLELMPIIDDNSYSLSGTLNKGALCKHSCTSVMFQEESPLEAVYNMICWLLERNYIKKGE